MANLFINGKESILPNRTKLQFFNTQIKLKSDALDAITNNYEITEFYSAFEIKNELVLE